MLSQQYYLEEEAYKVSREKYYKEIQKLVEANKLTESKEISTVIKVTIDKVIYHIDNYFVQKMYKGKVHKAKIIILDIVDGDIDKLALIAFKTVLGAVLQKPIAQANTVIAKEVFNNFKLVMEIKALETKEPKLFKAIENRKVVGKTNKIKQFIKTSRKLKLAEKIDKDISLIIGTFLIEFILNSGIDLLEKTSISNKFKSSTKALKLSNNAIKVVKELMEKNSELLTTHYPLIVPPKDWETPYRGGGYYTHNNFKFIRTWNYKYLSTVPTFVEDMKFTLDSVNQLQKINWKINTEVLDVVKTIIDNNMVDTSSTCPMLIGGIPYMEELKGFSLVDKKEIGEIGEDNRFINPNDVKKYMAKILENQKIINSLEGNRIQFMLAYYIANKFKKYDDIYFTYSCDSRGRVYPIQSYLNPHSPDNIKGLLQIKHERILSKQGEQWVKIYIANLMGYDKLTYLERIKKVNPLLNEIKILRDNPIKYSYLWNKGESPLLLLSIMLEYSKYLNDPKTPINITSQSDATCSGLQVYSGLLVDKVLAKSVNVLRDDTITDKINDVYQQVADKVKEYLDKGEYSKYYVKKTSDGKESTFSTFQEAQDLKDNLSRKLTKRNVMTLPYGVTLQGMTNQIFDILNEDEIKGNIWWKGNKFTLVKLLVELNLKAINELIQGAVQGQKMLKNILSQYLKTNDKILWHSPTGFLVCQTAWKKDSYQIDTPIGQLRIFKDSNEVSKQVMSNSIAPNFIHSIDSSILFKTYEIFRNKHAYDKIWVIHDSFGTFPEDCGNLLSSFKEAYLSIFSEDLIGKFKEELGLLNDNLDYQPLIQDKTDISDYIIT